MRSYNSPYSLNDDLTPQQFEELRLSGEINPAATYQDYLALRHEREERRAEAQRLGLTGDAPPELTPEDEEILMRAWAAVAAEKAAAEEEARSSARVT